MKLLENIIKRNLLGMDISQIDSFIEGYSAHISSSGSGPSESAIILPLLETMITSDGDMKNNPVWIKFQQASEAHLNTEEKIVVMAFIYRWVSYMLSRGNDYFGDEDIQILQKKLEELQNQIRESLQDCKASEIEIVELLLEPRKTMTTRDRLKEMVLNAADSAMRLLDSLKK